MGASLQNRPWTISITSRTRMSKNLKIAAAGRRSRALFQPTAHSACSFRAAVSTTHRVEWVGRAMSHDALLRSRSQLLAVPAERVLRHAKHISRRLGSQRTGGRDGTGGQRLPEGGSSGQQ
ncbi:hypothetical protein HPB50_015687 [Hyalomma asiaticum]|uniref:Uncharacterized protein n=1 Tax=Hyalomma asiaticum TaxID=266040 RepID=A0ACB7SWQ5_HYAAI|nr:hypothetical protein HPB50_015687 [Hyalomma asiaticum]